MINLRLSLFPGYSPDPINVKSAKICPVMAILDSINVNHGENEEEVIFLDLIELGIFHEVIDNTLKNKRTLGLTGMLTCHQNYAFKLIGLLKSLW